jgi:chromosome segregation ATPase
MQRLAGGSNQRQTEFELLSLLKTKLKTSENNRTVLRSFPLTENVRRHDTKENNKFDLVPLINNETSLILHSLEERFQEKNNEIEELKNSLFVQSQKLDFALTNQLNSPPQDSYLLMEAARLLSTLEIDRSCLEEKLKESSAQSAFEISDLQSKLEAYEELLTQAKHHNDEKDMLIENLATERELHKNEFTQLSNEKMKLISENSSLKMTNESLTLDHKSLIQNKNKEIEELTSEKLLMIEKLKSQLEQIESHAAVLEENTSVKESTKSLEEKVLALSTDLENLRKENLTLISKDKKNNQTINSSAVTIQEISVFIREIFTLLCSSNEHQHFGDPTDNGCREFIKSEVGKLIGKVKHLESESKQKELCHHDLTFQKDQEVVQWKDSLETLQIAYNKLVRASFLSSHPYF